MTQKEISNYLDDESRLGLVGYSHEVKKSEMILDDESRLGLIGYSQEPKKSEPTLDDESRLGLYDISSKRIVTFQQKNP